VAYSPGWGREPNYVTVDGNINIQVSDYESLLAEVTQFVKTGI